MNTSIDLLEEFRNISEILQQFNRFVEENRREKTGNRKEEKEKEKGGSLGEIGT